MPGQRFRTAEVMDQQAVKHSEDAQRQINAQEGRSDEPLTRKNIPGPGTINSMIMKLRARPDATASAMKKQSPGGSGKESHAFQ